MIGFSRSYLQEKIDRGDDYNQEYSIGYEYTGPPVSSDIPRIAPVDVRRIPTAVMAPRSTLVIKSDLPVVYPIVSKGGKLKKPCVEASTSQVLPLDSSSLNSLGADNRFHGEGSSSEVDRNNEDRIEYTTKKDEQVTDDRGFIPESPVFDRNQSDSSHGTLGFHDAREDPVSRSSDVGDSSNPRSSNSNEAEEDVVEDRKGHKSFVTFQDVPSNVSLSSSSYHDDAEMLPERPVVKEDGKNGNCYKCGKKNMFERRESCIVCGAKYCSKCVIRAMGSMQEGRKCTTCIGFLIDESNRQSLGKCSKMLRKLLAPEVIKQIMEDEKSCNANRPSPRCIIVNGKPLSLEEYSMLKSCPNPPKKLKPGRYWYDKVCGFWGKEGEKPCQIITYALEVGGPLKEDASNGNTNVKINNREITKPELRMLKAAGIHCEGDPHFWVGEDGSCAHEGMKNDAGHLWKKKKMKTVCTLLSLPYPSKPKMVRTDVERDPDVNDINKEQITSSILLLGDDQSGTSTIFKQARVLFDVPFTDDERQDLKKMIQKNLYKYIALLIEGRGILDEENESTSNDSHPSGSNVNGVHEKKGHAFSPRLEVFSSELLQMMYSGSLDIMFPASNREYSPLVEELWNDKSFKEIYQRRKEIKTLPGVASYFLEKAIEISSIDYEPSQMDIVHAEGISSSNGVASVEFTLPLPNDEVMDLDQSYSSMRLIRVSASSLGEKCKFLPFFEGTDLVIFCASLTSYDEYEEDQNGRQTNKMMMAKKFFETVVTHPILAETSFLLILNKYDLLEKKLKQTPLQQCDWFHDFNPVTSLHPEKTNGTNTSLEQKAFHYIAVKFKRLFTSLTGRKLYVSRVSAWEPDTVDNAVRYCEDILKWKDTAHPISTNEWSCDSIEQTQSTCS